MMRNYNCRGLYSSSLAGLILVIMMAGLLFPAHLAFAATGRSESHVSGLIVAEMNGQSQIALPNITVYVKDFSTLIQSPKVSTDLEGRFIIPVRSAGTYKLCWEAPGFSTGCSPKTFSLNQDPVFLQSIKIVPKGNSIFGHVTLADGSPCHQFDPFFELNVSTSVALVDSTGHEITPPVMVNVNGDYLAPNVPAHTVSVRASCEAAVAEATVTADASKAVNLIFRSQNPTITELVATLNGQNIEGAPPGSTVKVRTNANDSEGNTLHYKWVTTTPGFTAGDTTAVQWTLPKGSGLHRLYVVVSNGKGGYQMGRIDISSDDGVIPATTQQEDTRNLLSSPALQSKQVFSRQTRLTRTLPSDPHLFLTKKGVDDRATAEAYYKAIDPLDQKTTLKQWKLSNGFLINPDANKNGNAYDDDGATNEVSAAYLNARDLRFGRAMHAKKRKNGPAYYVCNHPNAKDAAHSVNRIACVTMEYSVVPGVNGDQPFTKFYVFDNQGRRIPSADLDGRGEKYVPSLCMACHGGNHTIHPEDPQGTPKFFHVGDNPNVKAQFLPFDLDNFIFADLQGFRKADQQQKFRRLNKIVKDTDPVNAIRQLINGWYPPRGTGTGDQFSAFLPPGWDPLVTPSVPDSAPPLYQKMVKPSCRTCHVAMGHKLDWVQFSEFNDFSATIRDDICRARTMPQALVTFKRFWLIDHPFLVLRRAGLSGWPSSAECPCGGPGEPSCAVAPANVPPVAKPDSAATKVNTSVLIDVLTNDTDANDTIDSTSVAIASNPANGSAVPNSSGVVTYQPNTDFSGSDSFIYTVKDSQGATSNQATVTVSVTNKPVAVDDAFMTSKNTQLTGASVLANDSGANLTAVLDSSPSQAASFTLNTDGTFSYTPSTGFIGDDAFTYHANDGTDDSNAATVTIKVVPPFSDIQAIFGDNSKSNACTNSGCHSGAFAPDLRNGSSYDNLVNQASSACLGKDRVEPGDAANSCLFLKITGTGGGSKMPQSCSGERPTGNCLSQAQIDAIKAWINGGALP